MTRRAATAVAVMTALALSGEVATASNIDQGFALDGATTYCQGVKGGSSGGVLGLADLPVDSVGKCPVGVTLSMGATTVKQKDNVAVTWKAKAILGLTTNNFPSSVDVTTHIPKAVVSSLLKACKAGTNCQTVIDSVPTGPANAEAGAFDATGSKDMRASQFTFTDVGDYIIAGKVTLPGDASLNISATDYIAFKKITVVDVNTVISPTPSPSPAPSPTVTPSATPAPAATPSAASGGSKAGSHSATSATNEDNVISPSKNSESSVGTVKPGSEEISSTTTSAPKGSTSRGDGSSSVDASTSSSKGIFGSNSVLLGCVFAGCFVAFVMGFAFVMRRRTESKLRTEKSSDNPPDLRGSVGMLDNGDFAAQAKYVENKSSKHKSRSPRMSISPPPIVLDASVRNSEINLSTDEYTPNTHHDSEYQQDSMYQHSSEYQQRDVSEVSSLASELYSDTLSNFDDSSRDTDDHNLGSFDWKESEYSRQTNSSVTSKGRGFSTASAMSDLSEGPRESRIASEASVDSYAFGPSPRSSRGDSYAGGYSESSRISGMSMYSDVSSVTDV